MVRDDREYNLVASIAEQLAREQEQVQDVQDDARRDHHRALRARSPEPVDEASTATWSGPGGAESSNRLATRERAARTLPASA